MPRLPAASREYLRITLDGLPDPAPAVEVRFPPSETWVPLTLDGNVGSVLVAGPDADAGTAVVLPLGRTLPVVRMTDNPEIVIRGAGPIDVG